MTVKIKVFMNVLVCVAECQALKADLVPLRPGYRYVTVSSRYGRCPAKPSYPLCSDDQWVSELHSTGDYSEACSIYSQNIFKEVALILAFVVLMYTFQRWQWAQHTFTLIFTFLFNVHAQYTHALNDWQSIYHTSTKHALNHSKKA